MGMDKKKVVWEESVHLGNSRVAIEGVLKLPDGMGEMATVADTAGEAEICEVKIAEGRATVEGRVRFTVLYVNTLGMVDSFESESRFSHTEEDARIKSDMQALAKADIAKISVRIQDGRAAALRADICMSIFAAANCEDEIVAQKTDAELLCAVRDIPVCATVKTARIVMERSVRIPQTMPKMERILLSGAHATVKRAERDEGDLAIEGEVYASVVYLSEDKHAPMQNLCKALAFGDIIEGAGADRVTADVRVEKMNVYQDPDDGDSLLIRITLAVTVAGQTMRCTDIVRDMYSGKCELELEKRRIEYVLRSGLERERRHMHIALDIPEESPEISRVLYASGKVEHIEKVCGESRVICEGTVTVVAATEAGTRGINIPVSFELPCPESAAEDSIRVYVCEITASGAGRSLDAAALIELAAETHERHTETAVVNVAEKDAAKKQGGVIVYFADGDETLWEIAKKFRVKKDSLCRDMDADERVPRGKRLIMLK